MMSKLAIVFWVAFVAAFAWGAWAFIALSVSASYHQMAANGDLLFGLKQFSIGLVVLIGLGVAFVRAGRGYSVGLVLLACVVVFPFLPKIDSGYEQTYFIGDVQYDIPWQYSPSGGNDVPGGDGFRIRVSLSDLAGGSAEQYRSLSQTVTLRKAVRDETVAAPTGCEAGQYTTLCEWAVDGFVYTMAGDTDLFDQTPSAMRDDVVAMLDGFATTAE